jgi:hypothetical protein
MTDTNEASQDRVEIREAVVKAAFAWKDGWRFCDAKFDQLSDKFQGIILDNLGNHPLGDYVYSDDCACQIDERESANCGCICHKKSREFAEQVLEMLIPQPTPPATVAGPTHPNGVPMGKPWSEVKANLLKDPEVKAEYDKLTVAEGSEELLPIRRLGAQGSYNALREFARTLTAKTRELEAQESSYRLGTGHAAGILQSMIENFVYAAIKTGVNQEYHRHAAIPKEEVERAIGDNEPEETDPSAGLEPEDIPPSHVFDVSAQIRNQFRSEIRSKLGLDTANNANTGGGDE